MTPGRIAAAHGRFSGIRKVAPACTPPNKCFLAPTEVHNPNSISIRSAIFAQLTAEYRRFAGHVLSPKIAPWHGAIWSTRLIHGFLGTPESISKATSRSVQPFCTALTERPQSPCFTMGRPFSPELPLPLLMGDLDSHLIFDSWGQSKPTTQTASRSVQPLLQGHYCDRPDHATRSVTKTASTYVAAQ